MCDDYRLGISMIFYLQNAVDYLHLDCPENTPCKAKLTLSGLSLNGCIILGNKQNNETQEKRNFRTYMRNQLIAKAKNGDQDAIDSLTIDEIDLSTRINKRIKTEDVYSIVETSFIPYGSESDNYSILGTILNWNIANNPYTKEDIYELLVNCNGIVMNISINSNDLIGEPMVGRRFKGTIWICRTRRVFTYLIYMEAAPFLWLCASGKIFSAYIGAVICIWACIHTCKKSRFCAYFT